MTTDLHEIRKGKKDTVEDFIKTRYSDHKLRMVDLYREWALTLAWTGGHQNVNFNSKRKKWEKTKRNEWQTRLISNLLLPLVRSKVARLYTPRPLWDTIPATPDQEDIDIANVSKKILQDTWVKENLTTKMIRKSFWQSTCGNAFMKVGWDPKAGKSIEIDPRSLLEQDLDTFMAASGIEILPEMIEVNEGELFVDPISPFNLFFDHMVDVFDDSDWCIEVNLTSKDSIIAEHGNKWKDKLSETNEAEALIHPYIYTDDNQHVNRKGVLTFELFIVKGKRFKNGLYAKMADDQMLISPKDLPFNHGKKPYVHFLEIYSPLSPWGTCVAQHVRPNQARYNKIQSTITDHIILTSKVQWLIPRQAQVQQITNRPGENIHYNGVIPPSQTKPQNIPMYVENTLERTRRDMQDTSSFHNVSQGQGDQGVRSGRAVLALQDADDSIDAPIFGWEDESLRKLGVLVLETINQFTTEEKIIKTRGEFNELQTLTYTGEMLVGESQGDYFDVRVKTYGRHILSRAGREAQVMQYVNLGLLNPQVPADRDIILEMLGSGDTERIFDQEEADRTRQWNEVQTMLQGQPVDVLMGENHKEHLKMLQRFIASGKRDQASEESIKLIQDHYLKHLKMQAAELVQQQIIAQGAIQGAYNTQTVNDGSSPAGGSGGGNGQQPGGGNPFGGAQRIGDQSGSLSSERANEAGLTGVNRT